MDSNPALSVTIKSEAMLKRAKARLKKLQSAIKMGIPRGQLEADCLTLAIKKYENKGQS